MAGAPFTQPWRGKPSLAVRMMQAEHAGAFRQFVAQHVPAKDCKDVVPDVNAPQDVVVGPPASGRPRTRRRARAVRARASTSGSTKHGSTRSARSKARRKPRLKVAGQAVSAAAEEE